jgi:hypothetical protein
VFKVALASITYKEEDNSWLIHGFSFADLVVTYDPAKILNDPVASHLARTYCFSRYVLLDCRRGLN